MTPLADLTPLTEVLPPTAGGKARAVYWYRGLLAEGWATDLLFVVGERGKSAEGYAVVEVPGRFGCRSFRVRKAGSGGGYAVHCGPRGGECDCPAGEIKHVEKCRHVLAIQAALDNGWLGDPPAPVRYDFRRAEAAF